MLDKIYQESETRMKKSLETLQQGLSKLRTGRAHPSLLDGIMVPYYGNDTPLNQVANVVVEDPRTLSVTPWEKTMVQAVDKAIRASDLGLNPNTAGTVIRVPLPPLTEERRKDLARHMRQEVESARVAVRNIRRDANNQVKQLHKSKEISEDEQRRAEDKIQKLTDRYIGDVDKHAQEKEADLMQV